MQDEAPQKKHKKARLVLKVAAVLALMLALAVIFWEQLPYNNAAAGQIRRALANAGLEVESLEVVRLSTSRAELEHIQIGKNPGFSIEQLQAGFTLQQFQTLLLHEVAAERVKAHVYADAGTFKISGLEALMTDAGNADGDAFNSEKIKALLPEHTSIKELALSGADAGWSFNTLLDANIAREPAPKLIATTPMLNAVYGEYTIGLQDVELQATLPEAAEKTADEGEAIKTRYTPEMQLKALALHADSGTHQISARNLQASGGLDVALKQWNAKLVAENLTISGIETPIPPMHVVADVIMDAKATTARIRAEDATKKYRAEADITLPAGDVKAGRIVIKRLRFPWGGGAIALKPVTLPLNLNTPLKLSIALEKVQLSELLATLGEGKINGTGEISGILPITYYPDGRVTLQEGKAEALQSGLISVSPTLLPGENEQLQIARAALENFHYTMLKISVSSDKQEKSTIHLTLEGNNPDAFGGRPIKLNVNLAGDVLPLIQQSILPINNLKHLLELQDTP